MGAAEIGRVLVDCGGPLIVGALSVAGIAADFAGLAGVVLVVAAGSGSRRRRDLNSRAN